MPPHAAEVQVKNAEEESGGRFRPGGSLIWMLAIVAVGAGLRLIGLGHKSFWIDEIASVAIARRSAPVFWHFLWHDEGNMALYYVLLRPWLRLGYGEGTVRMLSVLAGILTMPVMYLLGSRLFGRRTGVVAAALLALSPCAIGVSQEARAYSFVVLAVLLSTYLFVLLLEKPGYKLATGYGIVAGLTCYFHYFGILVPAAHAVSLLAIPRSRRSWKPWLLAIAVIMVMASPILWLMHAQNIGHIAWVRPTSWLELYHLGVFLAASGGKAAGAVLLALELTLVGLFAARCERAGRAGSGELGWCPRNSRIKSRAERRLSQGLKPLFLRRRFGTAEAVPFQGSCTYAANLRDSELGGWRYMLVASLVVSPLVITLLVSIVRPVFYHRFLIICLPGWLLMIALGIEQIRRRGWRTAAIAGVCLLSLASTVILYRHLTEDWRGAVNYLIANARSGDRALYYQSVGEFAGESYRDWLPGGNQRRPTPVAVNSANMHWYGEVDHAQRVWLVLYRAKSDSPESQRIEGELAKQYRLDQQKSFRGVTVLEYNAK